MEENLKNNREKEKKIMGKFTVMSLLSVMTQRSASYSLTTKNPFNHVLNAMK